MLVFIPTHTFVSRNSELAYNTKVAVKKQRKISFELTRASRDLWSLVMIRKNFAHNIPESGLFADFVKRLKNNTFMCFHE